MKKSIIYLLMASLFVATSCSSDDDGAVPENFVVAFENPSLSFSTIESEKQIKLVFSTVAPEDGTVNITYTTENADYGTDGDFTTVPSGESGSLTIAFTKGTSNTSFTFHKLQDAIEGTPKAVNFSIASISVPNATTSGNTASEVSFTESAAVMGSISPEVGGPNQDNQVFVDLSSLSQTASNRASWDLGFYNGDDFRVIINGSIFMAVAELDATDIDAVTAADVAELQSQVAVGTFDPTNTAYIDGVAGNLENTAIAQISTTVEENKVYLANLGFEVGSETPTVGSVALSGSARGWKKIRILRDGNDYLVQYADLDDTDHTEVTISKSTGSVHFNFLNLVTGETATVQPNSDKWDLNFTVFTNEIPGNGSYGYADFITTNNLSGVEAYMVETSTKAYADFTVADVDEASFSNDQRAIGSGWRNGGGPGTLPSLKDDVFYILKDTDGNIYKIRFTALLNENGERGFPRFEFELL